MPLFFGPQPRSGESAYDAYVRLDSPGAADGPITPVMQAFVEGVRARVGAPDDSWLDGGGSLEGAVSRDHVYLAIRADDDDLSDRVSAAVREVSADLDLMVYDPHLMLAWLPGQDAPVDGQPPTEGPYAPFDQIEVFVSAEPLNGRPAYQLYDEFCQERWLGCGEEPDPDERILALITAIREGLGVPDESFTAEQASLLDYVHGTALHLRLRETGGLGRWEQIFAVVRREAQTLGLLYYDPVRQVALVPGESEPVPCVRPEPDPATFEPMPEPGTAEEERDQDS